jgi:1-carboxybiuret hydrolase subunit AtzG-like
MSLADDEIARFVPLAAQALELSISPASLQAVLDNFRTLAAHAALVMACPLPPEVQIAPVFRP